MKYLTLSFILYIAIAYVKAHGDVDIAPTNKGGIVTAIGQVFFDQYKNTLVLNFFDNLQKSEWPSNTRIFPMPPHLTVNYTASDFKLLNMTFNPKGTVFDIHTEKPQVILELQDVNCTFEFKYNITTDPMFIQDIGKGYIQVVNLSPKLAGSPQVVVNETTGKKQHQIELDNVELSADNFEVTLDGGDVAHIISGFSDTYTEYIKTYIMTQFSESMRQAAEDTINSNLNIEKTTHAFPEQGFEVDYALVDDGVHISDKFISSIVDGTFHPIGMNESDIEKQFGNLPFYESNGREVQVLVSEYSMNTILKSMIALDKVDYETYMTSDEILALIDDFEEPFGDQDDVKLIIKATKLDDLHQKYHPQVTITPQESIYEFSLDIHIMNPYDQTVDAMLIRTQITAYISYTIDSNFTLFSYADDVEAELTELDSYFKTRTTKNRLNDRLQFARPILIGYLNSILEKGIKIPIGQNITQYIVDPRVRHFEKYLFIDGMVDFESLDQPLFIDFSEPVVKQKLDMIQ